MTFAQDHEKLKSDRAENERQIEEDIAINSFFAKHAEAVNCTASWKAIQAYFDGDPITEYALEESWNNHSGLRKMLATQTPAEDRDKLEVAIKELLAGGSSPGSVNEQTKKFRFKSTDELRLWLNDLKARKDAREKTPDELRQVIQAAAPGLPPLPAHFDRHKISKQLTGPQIRELARKYGMAAINARLNSES